MPMYPIPCMSKYRFNLRITVHLNTACIILIVLVQRRRKKSYFYCTLSIYHSVLCTHLADPPHRCDGNRFLKHALIKSVITLRSREQMQLKYWQFLNILGMDILKILICLSGGYVMLSKHLSFSCYLNK